METNSHIYLRRHKAYDEYDVYKLGRTDNTPERDDVYSTGEVERGEFISVYEVPSRQVKKIERDLQYEFCNMNVRFTGGREFYKKEIAVLIEPYFLKNEIKYRKLEKKEIDALLRKHRIQKIRKEHEELNNSMIQKRERKYVEQPPSAEQPTAEQPTAEQPSAEQPSAEKPTPNHHQESVLNNIVPFYRLNDIGKLEWACGLGKALLSIFIVAMMHFKTVIIGVPSNYLQKQMKNEILKIYPRSANILYVGGDKDPTDEIKRTTNPNEIKAFLKKPNNMCKFIVATYHSCRLIVHDEIEVDFKIGDEAHHLVGIEQEEEKGFRSFHKIKSKKTLFMTATEKTIISRNRSEREIYSMDDERIFGKTIDTKSVKWAIDNKKITDYSVLVLKNTEEEVNNIITRVQINVSNKEEIFMSAYMTLKSIEKYPNLTHSLLYTNTIEDAEFAEICIDFILNMNILRIRKEDVYNKALHSKHNRNLEEEVDKFKRSSYGIISCVYIFGEGFDLPNLNGVCVAGNMQSVIRIVQYLLRPNRLDKNNPNKHAYVIIPYIDKDDWENENKSFEKVRNIVSQLRNVDENIEQKISVSLLTTKQQLLNINEERNVQYNEAPDEFEENGDELTNLKLRLRYSKALGSKFTEEQDEFNYVKSINHSLHISSKREYVLMEPRHSNFIHNAEEYFKAKGVWTNWYDFMGVDTMKFIQSKQDWINFCKEKNVISLDSYYDCCEIYQELPKEPADFYRDFTNISNEIGFYQKRRR